MSWHRTTMKRFILTITILAFFSCNEKPQTIFSLNGTTNGIENGTILYLDKDQNLIDSTRVENNSFSFNTQLSSTPLLVVLRTKDFSHYRFLWLENKPMTFDGSNVDFRKAIVTGSYEEDLCQAIRMEPDSLPREERMEKEMDFVKNNPKSLHSAYVLSVYSKTWGKNKTEELFNSFSTENKNSDYGKTIAKYIELNRDPQFGEKFVDFEMKDTNEVTRRLSDINANVVLLEFWASTCAPCRIENPNLVKIYEQYKPKGFEIFAVSEDINRVSWINAIKKDELPWIQVSDLSKKNSASLIYGVSAIPDNFLINKNGIIIGRNLRGEQLNHKLAEILN